MKTSTASIENSNPIAQFMELPLFRDSQEFKEVHGKLEADLNKYNDIYIIKNPELDSSIGNDGWEIIHSFDLKYNSDWSWLMPVIEKIESLGYKITIEENSCQIHSGKTIIGIFYNGSSKLDATYKAVLSFVKTYQKYS